MAGIERRSEIDTATFKGLLAINGGGVVALLSFLAAILDNLNPPQFIHAILWGVLLLIFGLASAVIHNHLRRRCSLIYEMHDGAPQKGKLLGAKLSAPTVCLFSWAFMWLSLASFLIAGSLVAIIGLLTM